MVGGFRAGEECAEAGAFDGDAFFGGGAGGGEQGGFVVGRGVADELVEVGHFFFDGGGFLTLGVHGVEADGVGGQRGGQCGQEGECVAMVEGDACGGGGGFCVGQCAGEAVGKQAGGGGVAFDDADGEAVGGEDESVAAEAAGGVDDVGGCGVADGFGNEFAAAFCAPVLRRAGGEVDADAAFRARLAQADAVGGGVEEEAV